MPCVQIAMCCGQEQIHDFDLMQQIHDFDFMQQRSTKIINVDSDETDDDNPSVTVLPQIGN